MTAPLADRARARWRGILPSLGISAKALDGRHGPCPICREGRDRFRFDDKDGSGSWICSHCGGGYGAQLVMKVNGWDFKEAARQIEALIGKVTPDAPTRKDRAPEDIRASLRRMWCGSAPAVAADAVGRYLAGRGLDLPPMGLRTAEKIKYQGDPSSWHPAMIGVVSGPDGKPVTLHRTYLGTDGGKADVAAPRRLMPGDLPKGSAIRLAEAGDTLGIAEGIETALAAASLFGIPVWAAVNTARMQSWEPPAEVREVAIFADHDLNFAGQAAAYTLAHRIERADRRVRVEIPAAPGDWNDVLLAQRSVTA